MSNTQFDDGVMVTDNLIIQEVNTQELLGADVGSLDLADLHAFNAERYPFLLESVAKSTPIEGSEAELGQFDILFAFPQYTLQLDSLEQASEFAAKVQAEFKANITTLNMPRDITEAPFNFPFFGGWFAYFSYDYAQVVEPILDLPKSEFPLASLTRVPSAVLINHKTQQLFLVSELEFTENIETMLEDIEALFSAANHASNSADTVNIVSATEEPENKYLSGVEAIKEYIFAGDVFQVNLSRLWKVELENQTDYIDVYRALRKSNPAPFAALANFKAFGKQSNDWQILSSSPERLVKYDFPWVETRPIAGTRKRGEDKAADIALIKELIEHPKERAEHIMLIDLERNDLGRICQPGTVEVNDLMVIETYEHVHHIVSNVRGKLRTGFSPLDIVHALFPGGTITGCPKIRCMQIVAELEQMPREAYTGSLGFINLDGSMDLNILIRSMIQSVEAGKPVVQFRAGAGIVADSQADFELVETRHKAKGLIRAFSE